jgi:uncharacterized protein (DUF2147 family)
LLILTTAGTSQTSFVEGTWIIRDLVLSIFDCQHQVCGRIVWLSDPARRRDQCGKTIIWGLQSKGPTDWDGGSILDPNNGITYQLSAKYEPDGTLHARIFKGASWLGKTEILTRVDVRKLNEVCP